MEGGVPLPIPAVQAIRRQFDGPPDIDIFRILNNVRIHANRHSPIHHKRGCGDVLDRRVPPEDVYGRHCRPPEKLYVLKGRRNESGHLIPAASGQETEYELKTSRGNLLARLVKEPLAQSPGKICYRGYDSNEKLLFNVLLRTENGNDSILETLEFRTLENETLGFFLKKSSSPNLAFMNGEGKVVGVICTDSAKTPQDPEVVYCLDTIICNSKILDNDNDNAEAECKERLGKFSANYEFYFTETMGMLAKGLMIGTLIFNYEELYPKGARIRNQENGRSSFDRLLFNVFGNPQNRPIVQVIQEDQVQENVPAAPPRPRRLRRIFRLQL